MMLKRLTPREKLLLKILIIVIIVVSFIKLGYGSIWTNMKELQNKVELERENLQEIKNMVNEKHKIMAKLSSLKKELENKEINHKVSWVNIGESLKGNDIKIISIQPFPLEQLGTYFQFKLQIELEGKLSSIIAFINSMEAAPNSWLMEKISIKKKREGNKMFTASIWTKKPSSKEQYHNNYSMWLEGLTELQGLSKKDSKPLEDNRRKIDKVIPTIYPEEGFLYKGNYSFPLKIGGER